MTPAFPEVILGRLLEALEHELIEASDAEILAAAQDLGMDLTMKGSAAFLGLKYPYRPQHQDFFASLTSKDSHLAVERLVAEHLVARRRLAASKRESKSETPRARPPRASRSRRDK